VRRLSITAALLYLAGWACAQPGPLNLGFEQGQPGQTPAGWFVPIPSQRSGYTARLTGQNPKSGTYCAVITHTGQAPPAGFGNLMQSFDATAYRGQRVRFRAAVRAEVAGSGNQAQLWLRVDRKDGRMGFFDNMGDRPITAPEWGYYEIVGNIQEDGATINLGIMLLGRGSVWIDDASFEVLGAAAEPVRPLTERGLRNLVAFARLLGYVRHFHPSDEAARANWELFAMRNVAAVEDAQNPADLAQRLESLFRPVAPTLRVYPSGRRPPLPADLLPPRGQDPLKVMTWYHVGFGTGNMPYRSERKSQEAPGIAEPFEADLGGGVSCLAPLALFADAQGTLPHPAAGTPEPEPAKTSRPADNRAIRLAGVILAWNIFQHFYPYFEVVRTDWPAQLEQALRSAATDKDDLTFLDTLRRLVAALHDGHGNVFLSSPSQPPGVLPIAWDWIEGQLVITQVADSQGQPIVRGDAVVEIDGKPTARALAEAEALVSGATPQWIRVKALQQLSLGPAAEAVTLAIESLREPGQRRQVTLKRVTPSGPIREPRPEKVQELEPGLSYVDLDRISDADWEAALPQLEKARGIIFDLRGYPKMNAWNLFSYLAEKELTSAQWHVPVVTRPDRKDIQWLRLGECRIPPRAPYLKARKAFLTDGRAISYAESCMGIVEYYRLGEIVGGPTAGTNGNVNRFSLPGGYTLMFTGMKVLKHDGSQHHGVGILPTIPVSRTRAGVAAGRDELLERAVQAVKN